MSMLTDEQHQLLQDHPDAIAVIGMAGRFPGAGHLAAFWDNLKSGREGRTELDRAQLLQQGIAAAQQPDWVAASMSLDDIDCFDAAFFGISDKQASWMDPQIRLFLQTCWHAMEDAGYDVSRLGKQRVGVFAGSNPSVYLWQNLLGKLQEPDVAQWLEVLTYNDKDYLTTWVSYKLGLRGPSMNIQTACSTSLVAVATACQSLLSWQCDMALAGASGLMLPDRQGYRYQPGTILSPDGHCRPFDADGEGTIMGSGVACVVLKRLEDALKEGDTIDALILSAAINNDAQRKMDFMAPGVDGQVEVIRMAHRLADVSPDSIDYVETHGTGTRLGDPIEFRALQLAFGQGGQREQRCALGAVKSNVGHLNTVAGMAGLIKTVLSLKHELLPPTLHYRQPNPQLKLEGSPFFINDRVRPWLRTRRPRRAGVSAFGFGGTNAHLVVQEAPLPVPGTVPGPALLVLSARDHEALQRQRQQLADWLQQPDGQVSLADLCHTAAIGRKVWPYRQAWVVDALADLPRLLSAQSMPAEAARSGKTAWVFSGQGAHYPGMALGLYPQQPVFREAVARCVAALPVEVILPLQAWFEGSQPMASVFDAAAQLQPVLFTLQYGLAQLWLAQGAKPDVLLGHSLGEYVAAHLAGVLSLEDALRLVCERGRLMDRLPRTGGMLVLRASLAQVENLLRDGFPLQIAAHNGPEQVVVSGAATDIERLQQVVQTLGLDAVRLPVSSAFHSAWLDPILDEFEAVAAQLSFQPPKLPWVRNLDGRLATQAPDARYWRDHLRQTVCFAESLQQLQTLGVVRALEIGPRSQLAGLLRQALPDGCLTSLDEGEAAPYSWLRHAGEAFRLGYLTHWQPVEGGRRIHMPGYAFAKTRYWLKPEAVVAATPASVSMVQVPASAEAAPADMPVLDEADPLFSLIAGYWQQALGTRNLSRDSDFFLLGGNSLAAVQIRAALQRDLGLELPLGQMMSLRTLGDMLLAVELLLEQAAEGEALA
ncbi:type I polyketide synthase [Leeia sp.]|uniref:type I polyketide synthase n=1 Tax=Leeia sp. TaxID=2884678 RepID=UPI0035B231E0